ncbi:hypothetical protein [Noviherbaspirillum sp.]|uniref:hypothetical protein n=1 Tax=Noviherbaspirillum sp. TaxID=1926288 RepID=UPI002B48B7E4|nr:hypothetical protein [Noviherbaspirillum sp.]HJV83294.1 hypothetical protein [Noviherbaspirillum sp.]
MKQQLPQQIRLGKGRVLHMFMPARTTIVAADGGVRVTGPLMWIGEQAVQQDLVLREGEAHVTQTAGWAAVTAISCAEIRCFAPEPWYAALIPRLLAPLSRRGTLLAGSGEQP